MAKAVDIFKYNEKKYKAVVGETLYYNSQKVTTIAFWEDIGNAWFYIGSDYQKYWYVKKMSAFRLFEDWMKSEIKIEEDF